MQQPLGDGVGERFHALAVALGQRLPAAVVLGQDLAATTALPQAAQRGHGRQHLERAEPAGERLDLLLDDALGPRAPRPCGPRCGARPAPAGRRCRSASRPAGRRSRARCRAAPRGRAAAAGGRAARPMTSASSSAPSSVCGEDVEEMTMSARASSAGSASNEAVVAAEPLGERDRPLAAAVGDEHACVTPWSCSACAVSSAVSPAPMISTWRSVRSPSASRAASTATEATLARPWRDRGLGAHALAGGERGAEQLVGHRPGGAGGQRRLVRALDLALDLGLADDHRLQAARPPGTGAVPRRSCAASRCRRAARSGRMPARRASSAEHRRLGLDRVGDDQVELGAVAGGERRRPRRSPGARSARAAAARRRPRSARSARAGRAARSCARRRARAARSSRHRLLAAGRPSSRRLGRAAAHELRAARRARARCARAWRP